MDRYYFTRRCFIAGLVSVVMILILLLGGCSNKEEKASESKKIPHQVAVLTLGHFPLLDMILKELQRELSKSQDPEIKVTVFNANFQQELMRKSAREMVVGDFEVLVPLSTPCTQIVLAENSGRKPVVFSFVSTPKEVGWTGSGSLPNVTGFIDTVPLEKILTLISNISGPGSTIGYVVNDGEAPARATYETMAKLALKKGYKIKKIPVSTTSEIRPALTPVLAKVDCLFFGPDFVASGAADLIVELGVEHKIPTYCTDRVSVGRGCIGCVAPDYEGLGRKSAEYVKRIIHGEPTSNLPVVDFVDYLTYLNPTVIKKLGLRIPEGFIGSAIMIEPQKTPAK